MDTPLDLETMFRIEAASISAALYKARLVHPRNIRACGNIVEQSVRDFIKDKIPTIYHIGQGHIIDQNHMISPQIDVLITDSLRQPTILKTSDSTEYYCAESVYAFGEVKSTYRKRQNHIEKFCETIKHIKSNIHRKEEKNTAYPKLNRDSYIQHLNLASPNPILNPLFTFMFFVDGGDFRFDHFKATISSYESKYHPNMVVFLNKGIVINGVLNDAGLEINLYPENELPNSKWYYSNIGDADELSGVNLTAMYFYLLTHLRNCHLSQPDYLGYFQSILPFYKSRLQE